MSAIEALQLTITQEGKKDAWIDKLNSYKAPSISLLHIYSWLVTTLANSVAEATQQVSTRVCEGVFPAGTNQLLDTT